MEVDTLKIDLLHWLSSIKDKSVLAKIRKIQAAEVVSEKQYNDELVGAENEIKLGKGLSHKDATSHIKGWREK